MSSLWKNIKFKKFSIKSDLYIEYIMILNCMTKNIWIRIYELEYFSNSTAHSPSDIVLVFTQIHQQNGLLVRKQLEQNALLMNKVIKRSFMWLLTQSFNFTHWNKKSGLSLIYEMVWCVFRSLFSYGLRLRKKNWYKGHV